MFWSLIVLAAAIVLGYVFRQQLFFGTAEEDAYCAKVDEEIDAAESRPRWELR
jgi:hypothetical protein